MAKHKQSAADLKSILKVNPAAQSFLSPQSQSSLALARELPQEQRQSFQFYRQSDQSASALVNLSPQRKIAHNASGLPAAATLDRINSPGKTRSAGRGEMTADQAAESPPKDFLVANGPSPRLQPNQSVKAAAVHSYYKSKAVLQKRATQLGYGGGGPGPESSHQNSGVAEQRGTLQASPAAQKPPTAEKPVPMPRTRAPPTLGHKDRHEERAHIGGRKGGSIH